MALTDNCPNCNGKIHGRYCGECGQDLRIKPLSFIGIIREAFEEITDLDGRVFKTFITLLVHPGRITRDCLEQRRAGYLPPFRVFLIASVILYFFIDTLTGQLAFRIDLFENATHDAEGNGERALRGIEWLDAKLDAASQLPDFSARVFSKLPAIGFILLPFFGVLLKVVYLDSRRPFGEHLLAAVHIKTGVFLLAIVVTLISGIAASVESSFWSPAAVGNVAGKVTLVISSIYVGISLSVIYGGNYFVTAVRTLIVLLCYWVLATVGLLAAATVIALRNG